VKHRLTGADEGYDLIVDTTGSMLEAALPFVRRGGEILLIGLDYTYEARIRPSYLVDNSIRLIGTIDTDRTFATAISLLRRRPVFRQIVTHGLSLANYEPALGLLGIDASCGRRGEPRANKVVLVP